MRTIRNETWSWSVYLLHRLVRLWIVLLPGLLLCFLWDSIGLRTHSLLYHGIIPFYETGDISRLQTTRAFFGTLFFLHPMLVPTYGSDGPLWSLSYEFWYYILFPLGLIALRREFTWRSRSACVVGFLLAAWFVRRDILPMFPVWLLGMALTLVPVPHIRAALRWFAASIYLPLLFFFSRADRWPLLAQDYIFSVLTVIFLWIMLSANGEADTSTYFTRGSRGLARFSYTAYVVHQPLLLLAASILIGTSRWFPSMSSIAAGFGLLLFILLYSYGAATLTEFKTETVRQWIERWIGISSPKKQLRG